MSYLSLGDENDDEFAPSLGGMSSNLGSLFGMNAQMDNRAGSNQSLTYTAPKPPRPDKPQQVYQEKKIASSGVAAAIAITAYKYVGNQYQSQGKLGMALLSNYSERDFKILMYVSKQQPVTTARISADFQFNIQSNNYASFHDDQRQAWSILFPAFEQLVNFAKQVCLAKFHSQTEHGVISQDITLGESDTPVLALGDSVEAKYTGWLVLSEDGSLGNVFDSNHNSDKYFRFKTGKGKVIKGWEEGMLGMKKGGKRFLIIPPALAYGSRAVGNRVPPNSTLAFEVDIVRLKSSGVNADASNAQQIVQSENIELPSALVPGQPAGGLDVQQETIKIRAASINEQISGGNVPSNAGAGKSSLVSRMAKVGQPMLPMKPTMQPHEPHMKPMMQSVEPPRPSPTVAASPEAYHPNQLDARSTYSNSPIPAVSTHATALSNMEYQRVGYSPQPVHTVPLSMMQPALPGSVSIQPSGIMGINDISRQGFHSSYPQHFASSGADMLPAILAESQNSNYKLKALMEKVEEVSEKVSKIKSTSTEQRPASEMMDAAQISFNIQRILQENERVKKQIVERDKLVQQQSDKIADLLQKNHKLMEESHEQIAKRSVTFNETMGLSREKTAKLEQEKLEMSNKLSEANSKVYDLQLQLANASERANSLEKIAKSSTSQIENEVRIRQLESELSSAKESLASAQSENKKLEVRSQESAAVAVQERDKRNETKSGLEIEIKQLWEEMVTIKLRHEKELSSIREKYHSQQNDAVQRQQQLEDSWKEKCKNAVTKVSKAAEEKIKELEEEKEELSKKLEIFQKKMLQLRQMYQDKVNVEEQLKNQLTESLVFQQKYDNLRKQAISMKQQYEDKISELEHANHGQGDSPAAQIKSVMNEVFQDVRTKIDNGQEYSGSEILSIILSVIKSATLRLLKPKQSDDDDEEDQDADESDEDDDEQSNDDTKSEGSDHATPSETATVQKPDIAKKPNFETQTITSEGPVTEKLTKSESEPKDNLETTTNDEQETVREEEDTSHSNDGSLEEKVSELEPDSVANEQQQSEDSSSCIEEQNVAEPEESAQNDNTTSCQAQAIQEAASIDDVDDVDDASVEDTKPTPPPLFDDDDDEDDLGWLS